MKSPIRSTFDKLNAEGKLPETTLQPRRNSAPTQVPPVDWQPPPGSNQPLPVPPAGSNQPPPSATTELPPGWSQPPPGTPYPTALYGLVNRG